MQEVFDIIKKAFGEGSEVSMMRVMALGSLLVGSALAVIGLFRGSDLTGLAALSGVFVGSAFAGKVMQKKSEGQP